jgi:photosystem II stability/assembly factor-like uncharacterized protein
MRPTFISILFCVTALFFFGCRKLIELDPSAGGAKWKKVFREPAIEIFFSSPQNGAALTLNRLVNTTSGGLEWSYFSDSINTGFNLGIGSDTTLCVVGGTKVQFIYGSNKTIKTYFLNETFFDCLYIDRSTCILNGEKNIWITRNSGRSIERVLRTDSLNTEAIGAFKTIARLSNNRFWVARASGNLFETKDKGVTWNKINLRYNGLTTIQMLSEQLGFYADKSGLYKTVDGGLSWRSLKNDAKDLHFFNANVGYITNANNEILKTVDGGITWRSVFYLDNVEVIEIFFLDENNGWVSTLSGIYKLSAP